jgi:heme A synthase
MVGFLTVFVAATVAFALVVQGFYKPQPLFEKARFVDELLGGFLGLLQAAIILGAIVIILDSFFRLSGIPKSPNELPLLRDLWSALDTSQIVAVFRATIIPVFLTVTGFLVPSSLRTLYPLPS